MSICCVRAEERERERERHIKSEEATMENAAEVRYHACGEVMVRLFISFALLLLCVFLFF